MAISYVGSAAGENSVTMPAHQAGDLLLAFAYIGGSLTPPTPPAGWTTFQTSASNSNALTVAYKFAASSSETSGTWTGVNGVAIHVYRGVDSADPFGGFAIGNNVGIVEYPAITMQVSDGTSWVSAFAGYRHYGTSLETPPTGMVNRSNYSNGTADAEVAGHDTNGGVASWSAQTVNPGGVASRFRSIVVEVIAAEVTGFGGGGYGSGPYGSSAGGGSTSVSVDATGSGLTASAGDETVTAKSSTTVIGAALGTANGTVTAGSTITAIVTGSALTSAAGDVSLTAGASVAATGEAATATAGDVFAGVTVSVVGVGMEITANYGEEDVRAAANVSVSGTAITSGHGTATAVNTARVLVTGTPISAFDGAETVTGKSSATLTGVGLTGEIGIDYIIGIGVSFDVTGSEASVADGVATGVVRTLAEVSGNSITASDGGASTVSINNIALTGVELTAELHELFVVAWGRVPTGPGSVWVNVDDSGDITWVRVPTGTTPTWTRED